MESEEHKACAQQYDGRGFRNRGDSLIGLLLLSCIGNIGSICSISTAGKIVGDLLTGGNWPASSATTATTAKATSTTAAPQARRTTGGSLQARCGSCFLSGIAL
jgi:hypothetical protein